MEDVLISIKRLKEYITLPFYWNGIKISLKDIENYIIKTKQKCHNMDCCDLYMNEWNKRDHIERILYFIDYPEKITPIHIDNKCSNSQILPIPMIIDGQHRFIASVYRKEKYIPAIYSGLSDLFNYLTEKINKKPQWW